MRRLLEVELTRALAGAVASEHLHLETTPHLGGNMEIRISARAFAEFVFGSPSKKSATVRGILRPRSPETQIPRRYYARAIRIIRSYHKNGNSQDYLRDELRKLGEKWQATETRQSRTQLGMNLMAIEAYMRLFANRTWRITPCPRIHYSSKSVRISATPDLAVKDEKGIHLIKLGVRKEKEIEDVVRLMLRVIYQACEGQVEIAPEDIAYFDVSTGEVIRGAQADLRLARTIEGGCAALQEFVEKKVA